MLMGTILFMCDCVNLWGRHLKTILLSRQAVRKGGLKR